MNWSGKVCLVTGASSGLGRRVATRLAARGATIVAAARREDRLKALVDELGGEPHSHVVCDVSDLEQVRSMAGAVQARTGRVDLLLNNAGIRSTGPLPQTTSEAIERVLRTNLLGSMWCVRELLPLLEAAPRQQRTPVVINLASMGGRLAAPGAADYAAAKFGLVGFSESVWYDLWPLGIRVMVVNPGFAETEGFPMDHLRAHPSTAWTVMDADRVAKALIRGVERGAFEVRVQWWWHLVYHAGVLGGPLRREVTRRLANVVPTER